MRQFFVLVLFCSLIVSSLKAQTWNRTVSERIGFRLSPPTGVAETIAINLHELATDEFDGNDASFMSPTSYMFSTIANNDGDDLELLSDFRSYTSNFFVDFPIFFKTLEAGVYKLDISSVYRRPNYDKMVFIRLIDNENPNEFIVLKEDGGNSYSVNLSANKSYKNRFTLRIYAASLFKSDAESNDWSDLSNWIEVKEIPGKGNSVYDNCVVIPKDVFVEITDAGEFSVGTLFNSGELKINKGTELKVRDEARNASVSDLY